MYIYTIPIHVIQDRYDISIRTYELLYFFYTTPYLIFQVFHS